MAEVSEHVDGDAEECRAFVRLAIVSRVAMFGRVKTSRTELRLPLAHAATKGDKVRQARAYSRLVLGSDGLQAAT